MKAYIFCSSPAENIDCLKDFEFKNSFVICADGGSEILNKLKIVPDLWIGDMDSASELWCSSKKEILPCKKDLTDSQAAAEAALERGIKDIVFFGATGGRLDHEYANYCLLRFLLEHDAFGTIVDGKNKIFMLDKSAEIAPCGKKYISFFPFGEDVDDFSVKNVKYELENHTLKNNCTRMASNEFIGSLSAKVSFANGYVLVICSND